MLPSPKKLSTQDIKDLLDEQGELMAYSVSNYNVDPHKKHTYDFKSNQVLSDYECVQCTGKLVACSKRTENITLIGLNQFMEVTIVPEKKCTQCNSVQMF